MDDIEILLIEDSPVDALLARRAFQQSDKPSKLHVVTDGEQALRFLRREGEFTGAVCPHLILLDLNLPKKMGIEVLAEVKADADLRYIPVLVLTGSDDQQDVAGAYDLHANGYLRKPQDFNGYKTMVESVEEFWLGVVKLVPVE
jgi:two-component system response regulator